MQPTQGDQGFDIRALFFGRPQQVAAAPYGQGLGQPATHGQRVHGFTLQRGQGGSRIACTVCQGTQRFPQRHRFDGLRLIQVAVARRQRKAVVGPHRGRTHHLHRQRELARHRGDDLELLVVLLTEHRHRRLHPLEKLQHHGTHGCEEARPKLTLEDIGQRCGRHDLVDLSLGIELGLIGREDEVAACAGEQLSIASQGARVAVEVLMRQELQTVDKSLATTGPPQRLASRTSAKCPS